MQKQKIQMNKRQFRIGELAKKLKLKKFVIRFWEKEFSLKTTRSSGRQRFYTEHDFETFQEIKELLYNRGFTIAGAKKQLKSDPDSETKVMGSHKTTMDDRTNDNHQTLEERQEFIENCLYVQKQLLKLRELL